MTSQNDNERKHVHHYAWSGKMHCTGVYRCIHCGKIGESTLRGLKKLSVKDDLIAAFKQGFTLGEEHGYSKEGMTREEAEKQYISELDTINISEPELIFRSLKKLSINERNIIIIALWHYQKDYCSKTADELCERIDCGDVYTSK